MGKHVRAIRGTLDKEADPRPKKVDRDKAIADAAYQRYLYRQKNGIPGNADDDWTWAAQDFDHKG